MVAINDNEIYNVTALTATETSAVKEIPQNRIGYVEIIATNVSGTTPTFDISIEHSKDGVNFHALKSFTQITAASSQLIALADTEQPMDFVRVQSVVGGTTPSADIVVTLVGRPL